MARPLNSKSVQAELNEQAAAKQAMKSEALDTGAVIHAAEQIVAGGQQGQKQLCPLCQTILPEDHKQPLCGNCFQKLELCRLCGPATGRRVRWDKRSSSLNDICGPCLFGSVPRKDQPALIQVPTAPIANEEPEVPPYVLNLWQRLAKAKSVLGQYRGHDPDYDPTLRACYEMAESACDREEFALCGQKLNAFWNQKSLLDLAYRLSLPADSDISGQAAWYWDLALDAYLAGDPDFGHVVMDSLKIYLDDLDEFSEFAAGNIREILNTQELAQRNREARQAFMAKPRTRVQTQTTPKPVVTTPTTPTRTGCLICAHPTQKRLCNECSRALDTCPTCRRNKVYVTQDGRIMEQCVPCFQGK